MTINIAKWAMAPVLGSLALAPARAEVARNYQTITFAYTLTYGAVFHTDTVRYSPCDNSLSGSGFLHRGSQALPETIRGALLTSITGFPAGPITIIGNVQTLIPTNPFVYGFNGTVNSSGNASGIWATNTPPSFTQARLQIDMKSVVVSTWKTHGDYVAFSGETANDAAHSCIGMPVQSNN